MVATGQMAACTYSSVETAQFPHQQFRAAAPYRGTPMSHEAFKFLSNLNSELSVNIPQLLDLVVSMARTLKCGAQLQQTS